MGGFDPDFDDTAWNAGWWDVPVLPVPPGQHPSGYRIERQLLHEVTIFDQPYHLTAPFDCRLLIDPQERLWMSDTPQERIMMVNSGQRSRGHVLVGGLGLGVYPQIAAAVGGAAQFTIIEHSPVVCDLVEPTLRLALEGIPLEVRLGDIAVVLAEPVAARYDTIFLDTWETLDPLHLPAINRLRDLALRHLAPGGEVLLWGYQWMVRLFVAGCRALLEQPPARRGEWLEAHATPQALALLAPVIERFEGQTVRDLDSALDWCRRAIIETPLA